LGLPVLAHVEQQRPVVALETGLQLVRSDLAHRRRSPWGAPIWPPTPPHARTRPGGAVARLGRRAAPRRYPNTRAAIRGPPARRAAAVVRVAYSQPTRKATSSTGGAWKHRAMAAR